MGKDFGARVGVVAITVDPEREPRHGCGDTRKRTARAGRAGRPTGTPAEIKDVAQRYGVFARKTDRGDVDDTLPHRAVDRDGVLRVQYMGVRFDPDEMLRDPPLAPPGSGPMIRRTRAPARAPAPRGVDPGRVHAKLLGRVRSSSSASLIRVLGAVGLEVLGEVNRRSEDLAELQRKIAAYRQLQHDTTGQLTARPPRCSSPRTGASTPSSASSTSSATTLDRLQFVGAGHQVELLARVRADDDELDPGRRRVSWS